MSLIYITGIAGAGKSAVCMKLKALGYEAHEGDDNLSAFYNNQTGEIVNRPTSSDERTVQFRKEHTWKMSREKLQTLKNKAGDKPIFVCGVAANEDEYINVFDTVIALVLDTDTLLSRINSRSDSDFGKSEHERKTLLEWQNNTKDYYRKIKARIVDASQPLDAVVKEVLEVTGLAK